MDTIITKPKDYFKAADVDGMKIGKWTAKLQPDGTIIWTRLKSFFQKKKGDIFVYATPHYNQLNEVSVDIVGEDFGDPILQKTFWLKGDYRECDLKLYEVEMKAIFNILK
jgi:hypothetical protein